MENLVPSDSNGPDNEAQTTAIEAHAALLLALGRLVLLLRVLLLGHKEQLWRLQVAAGHAHHAGQQGHLADTRYLMAAPEGHEGHAGLQSVHEVTAGL